MRSASSSTKWLTSFSFSSPVDIRSQTRPGVPTTMSAPARIRCTCMKRLTPPRMATMRRVDRPPSRCRLVLDLQRQFAGRRQDEGACGVAMRLGGFACQVLQHRQGERGGLAGAGLGDAEQIAAGEQVRNGNCLDRRWFEEALSVEGAQQRLGQAERRKGNR